MASFQQWTGIRPSTGTRSSVHLNYGRSTSSPQPTHLQTTKLHQAEPRKQSVLPSTRVPSDLSEISGLRQLLHVASELQQIDLDSSLKAYKEFRKQTQQEHILNKEERILETRREQLAELNSDAFTKRLEKHEESLRALKQQNDKLQEEKKSIEIQCRQHQSMLDDLGKENQRQKENLKRKDDELRKVMSEKDAALINKNEMMTRLSKELGTKLSDNNPTIADLSDPNRAMKLGEKYAELYDNDWTDALEILCSDGCDEQAGIRILLDVLKMSYRICMELSEKQMTSLQMTLVNPALPGMPKPAWGDVIHPTIAKSTYKHIKECRKEVSTKAVENILKEYGTKQLVNGAEKIPDFVNKCLEICWLMCVQDPPVVIGGEATVGDTFDTNIYKPYTNSGTVVSYNVWPPLLLHENGPILVKGVVQPQKMERKKTMERRNLDQTKPTMAAKQRTDYNQTQRFEPTVRLTGQSGYDPHEDAYGRFEQDRKMKLQRNDTRRNNNADAVDSKTGYKAPGTQEKVYDTDLYRSPVHGHVESTNAYGQNHGYQTSPPSTNYVQTKVSPRAGHHLFKSGGVTYIKIGNEYYNYDVYKSVLGSRGESYA